MAKQRQVRMEQRGAMSAMGELEKRSDEQLEREVRLRAPARALLGARAAERYDAETARAYFREALSAARPQERMQIRRMADAALALAERRPDDLRAAAERIGQQAPSGRQLFLLRLMGVLIPGRGAPTGRRVGGALLILLIIVALIAVGSGIVALIAWPVPGGLDTWSTVSLGVLLFLAVLVGLVIFGRRRQKKAEATRAASASQQRAPTNRAARRRG